VVMERPATFCASLKAARVAKGVSLEQIAASTKINVSLLKGLECGNLSRWPTGLYRRSYLRDYVRAVGLPITSTVAEFVRLFPDADAAKVEDSVPTDGAETPLLSLTLVDDRADRFAQAGRRISAATLDAALVTMLSGTAALLIRADFLGTVAIVALGYYSLATAVLGHTFGARWVVHRGGKRWRKTAPSASRHGFRERIHRLRDLSAALRSSMARDSVRMPLNALLLRIRFLR
jgi:transcriptional regulator with XRE-family HTH domain